MLKHNKMKKLTALEMNRLSVDEFKQADKLPLTVVLDNVRSLHNVGSVFRSGDAFRIEKICLCGITATPPSAEIHKTALGAENSVEWEYYSSSHEAVEKLQVEPASGTDQPVMLERSTPKEALSEKNLQIPVTR